MSLAVSVAGQWTSTVQFPGEGGPTSLGLTTRGWVLSWTLYFNKLNQTDKFAKSTIENFAAGMDVSLSATYEEWRAKELKFLTVTTQTLDPSGAQIWNHGLPGTQASDSGAALVLSSVALTPARANSFTSISFFNVSIDNDFPVEINFGPDKAVLPFRGIVLPVDNGIGGAKYFATA